MNRYIKVRIEYGNTRTGTAIHEQKIWTDSPNKAIAVAARFAPIGTQTILKVDIEDEVVDRLLRREKLEGDNGE